MPVDINDPRVLDSQVIDSNEMLYLLDVETKSAISRAVETFRIPEPMDYCGKQGTARWTVGQLREWDIWKGRKRLELTMRRFEEAVKMEEPVKRKVALSRSAILAEAAELGIETI